MLKKTTTILLAILFSFAASACSETGAVDLDEEAQAAVDDLESQMTEIGDQLEAASVDEEIQSAWTSVESELTEAVESLRAGEAIDTAALEEQLDEFESSLQSVDVGSEIQQAWDELRTLFDQVTADIG